MDYQALYCRWAEATYGLTDVTSVSFTTRYDAGCPTCGDGDTTIKVFIHHAGGYETKEYVLTYDTTLINSLLEFNANA